MKITIRHVDARGRVVDATVTDDSTTHRIGHTTAEGWYCCDHGKRCRLVDAVRILIVPMDDG